MKKRGEKEAFWLAFEFAQAPYYFSPWGVAAISASMNEDMVKHPNTMCGNMAQYFPLEENEPELLFVSGKMLLEPFPSGMDSLVNRPHRAYNLNPTHITPRQERKEVPEPEQGPTFRECLTGLGSTPLPPEFTKRLLRRRMHFMAVKTEFLEPLAKCESDIFG